MDALNTWVRFSLKHPVLICIFVGLWTTAGVYATYQLPIDAVPDITNVQVQVVTSAPSLSPVEVEQYLTVPLERAMAGIPHLTEVRSVSKYGISLITLVFEDNTPLQTARQYVGERVREAQQKLSLKDAAPQVGPLTSGLGEIFQFTVQSPKHSLQQLKEMLDWDIIPQLRMVPGVVEVNSFGGETKEYQIVLKPQVLESLGLSLLDVAKTLEMNNANAGGGYLERNGEHWVISSQGLIASIEDLRSVVVSTSAQGTPVTLADIAEVETGAQLRRGSASMDGKGEVVVGTVMMLTHANAHQVTEDFKKALGALQKNLPKEVVIKPFYDRSLLVNRAVKTVLKNLAEGALLVMAVLFFLLGDLKSGLIVASVIPLAMLFTAFCMYVFGISGNLMSLGAIDFGLIVDGAVIIVENITSHLIRKKSLLGRSLHAQEKNTLVYESTCEVRGASIFGECIIAVVYMPILLLHGIEGKLFQPMALTVLFALAGAMVLSLTWVPVLCDRFLDPHTHTTHTWLMDRIAASYNRLITYAFAHKKTVLSYAVCALCAALGLLSYIGAEFMPHINEGDMLVEARRFPGTALTASIKTDARMQEALLKNIPEIAHAVSKTGAPDLAVDPMGLEQTDLFLDIKDPSVWRKGMTRERLGEQIVDVLEKATPEVAVSLSQPIQMRTNELVAGIRSDVGVQIYGPDLKILQEIADEIGSVLETTEGVADVKVEQGSGLGYLTVTPNRVLLARHGLTMQDVHAWVASTSVGYPCGDVFEHDRRFRIVLKTPTPLPAVDDFKAIPIKSPLGHTVSLGDIAEVRRTEGPSVINRSQQSRRRSVEFNVRHRDLMSTVQDAQKKVAEKMVLPAGYRIGWGGEYVHFISARNRLMYIIPLTVACMVLILLWANKALKPTLLILANIPFACIGGICALALRGMPVSISASVGFIALLGISVLNGLVFVAYVKQKEHSQGMLFKEDILRIAHNRLRPIVMTASVAALGFVPMALSQSAGSEIQRPLATVVIGGLVSSSLLTLLLLPILYGWNALSERTHNP